MFKIIISCYYDVKIGPDARSLEQVAIPVLNMRVIYLYLYDVRRMCAEYLPTQLSGKS